MEYVNVSVEFRWKPLGFVQLDANGRLVFPKAPVAPGLYRFDLEESDVKITYVGESDQLARRLQHYRTPGSSQLTNIRLNENFRRALSRGRSISVSVVTGESDVHLRTASHQIDISRKQDRVLLEHAALLALRAGGYTILNA